MALHAQLPRTKAIAHAEGGTYAAWFKTPVGQGTGIAHVADGKIWGRESIMSYSGICAVDGDRFTAIVTLKRHTEGHPTIFGANDLTLKLEGTYPGKIARLVATAEQVPGVLLEGTLIPSEEQPGAPWPSLRELLPDRGRTRLHPHQQPVAHSHHLEGKARRRPAPPPTFNPDRLTNCRRTPADFEGAKTYSGP
ncbi:hypothetical protein [Bradyrhizobium sp. RDI18]|uniref:hypothetical protein n=1 Tax=Bradyrhizobium sp. RDI18 TaxID=3367400 RepID=UPI00371EE51B